jgi:hypothetical protein
MNDSAPVTIGSRVSPSERQLYDIELSETNVSSWPTGDLLLEMKINPRSTPDAVHGTLGSSGTP